MNIYHSSKDIGSWIFSNPKYGYDYTLSPYNDFYTDLKKLLSLLISSKLLIPQRLGNFILQYDTIDNLIDIIRSSGYIESCSEFDIEGITYINTSRGQEEYSNIIKIEGFRTFQESFTIVTKSDIWLPISFDEQEGDFFWNLEHYELNYYRIEKLLNEINSTFEWQNNSSQLIINNERGGGQKGYKLFVNESIIKREYLKKPPNVIFDLESYLKNRWQWICSKQLL
jgi:hypothetical protein